MTSNSDSQRDTPITTYHAEETSWFRSMIRGRTRVALAWLYVALLIWFARDYPTWPGILLCFVGATIRYWASGYLRKDTRPAVGGPYAWVRNPLYLGTYLMALGTAWAIEAWGLLAFGTIAFAIVYHYIILDEETKLRAIFGAPYLRWCELVPRFFPRAWPAAREKLLEVNPEPTYHRFSGELAHRNKAYEAYVSFAGLIAFVAAVAWAWRNFS